jgi:hypothetical protein
MTSEQCATENNILLKADNTCTAFGRVASYVLLHHRARLTEIWQSGIDQAKLDAELKQTAPRNRWFCFHQDGHVVAASSIREHAVSYMTPQCVLIEREEAVTCKRCGKSTDALAVFPGGICLECYAAKEGKQPLTSADFNGMVNAFKRPA